MILKFSLLLLGLTIINSATQAQSNPLIIRAATLESVRIEVFYNLKTDTKQLLAYSAECKHCAPAILPINKTAHAERADESVYFAELLQWKIAIVDASYDTLTTNRAIQSSLLVANNSKGLL